MNLAADVRTCVETLGGLEKLELTLCDWENILRRDYEEFDAGWLTDMLEECAGTLKQLVLDFTTCGAADRGANFLCQFDRVSFGTAFDGFSWTTLNLDVPFRKLQYLEIKNVEHTMAQLGTFLKSRAGSPRQVDVATWVCVRSSSEYVMRMPYLSGHATPNEEDMKELEGAASKALLDRITFSLEFNTNGIICADSRCRPDERPQDYFRIGAAMLYDLYHEAGLSGGEIL